MKLDEVRTRVTSKEMLTYEVFLSHEPEPLRRIEFALAVVGAMVFNTAAGRNPNRPPLSPLELLPWKDPWGEMKKAEQEKEIDMLVRAFGDRLKVKK